MYGRSLWSYRSSIVSTGTEGKYKLNCNAFITYHFSLHSVMEIEQKVDSLNCELINDLFYAILKLVRSDDLSQMSNCNVILNGMIHDQSFILNKVHSINNQMKEFIDKKEWDGALADAAENGHLEICKYLVSIGATNFDSSLELAAFNGRMKICKYLVSLGDIDINLGLEGAAYFGHLDVCKYFVSQGAANFNWALKCAANSGDLEICKYFVSLGATDFDRALYDAVQRGQLDICKYLVSLGATNFDEALRYAIHSGHMNICKYLVSLGASNFNYALHHKIYQSCCTTEIYLYILEQMDKLN